MVSIVTEALCSSQNGVAPGLRRFRCPQCHTSYTEAHKPTLDGAYVSQERSVLALRLMVEGNSLRSTERITGLDINTLMKILVKAGEKCEKLMGKLIVNVPVKDLRFAYYNFCRIHKTLRVTPAMEAGIANHIWELAELLA
ncbi:hypothetical protein SBA3_4220014 [Candidatus Sulfopaludibacter sp. SbA3]|nr:hypothetical protein SBA3_4220014 [Candidatus Sulfopaludibacter sp. SbA3]